jgi:hypothetical protein
MGHVRGHGVTRLIVYSESLWCNHSATLNADEDLRPTYKVTRADIVQLEIGEYGIEFEFDDGYTDFAEVGSKETAESTPPRRWARTS